MIEANGRTVQGVILDLDCLMTRSHTARARAWCDALGQAGYMVPFEIVRKLVGMDAGHLLSHMVGVPLDSDLGRHIECTQRSLMRQNYLAAMNPLPRASSLLARIHIDDLALILATSAYDDEVDAMFAKLGQRVIELFDVRITAGDVPRSRPAHDVLRVALEKARLAPTQCVMLGSSPYNIAKAKSEGIDILAFRSGGWLDRDLVGAKAIYRDPADLLERYKDSILSWWSKKLFYVAAQRPLLSQTKQLGHDHKSPSAD